MNKREQAQKDKDLRSAQRAFDALRPEEKALIVAALHAGHMGEMADRAHWEWYALLSNLERESVESANVIALWKTRLTRTAEHLHHELEWADALFEAAARARVNRETALALQSMGPEKARRWLTDRLTSAAGPGRSTSTCSNLMRAAEAEALGRALEALKWAGM